MIFFNNFFSNFVIFFSVFLIFKKFFFYIYTFTYFNFFCLPNLDLIMFTKLPIYNKLLFRRIARAHIFVISKFLYCLIRPRLTAWHKLHYLRFGIMLHLYVGLQLLRSKSDNIPNIVDISNRFHITVVYN